jgi:hypothetical protein
MTISQYDENWFYLPSSWAFPDTKLSHKAFVNYVHEAYLIVDSIDKWRKKKAVASKVDLTALKTEVNKVSSVQI